MSDEEVDGQDAQEESWGDFFPDLLEPGIPVYGVRMIGFIDEDGKEAIIWDVHGEYCQRNIVGDLEFLKQVFNLDRMGIVAPEKDEDAA